MTSGGDDHTDPMLSPTAVATPQPGVQGQVAGPLRAPGYELGAVIGRGGMGEVLLARDKRIGRDVAIKRLLATDPRGESVARFLREAQIQARLDHPSIVPVHELGMDSEGRPFFTMKRLAGVTLAQRLAEPGPDTRALLNAFVDVCAAIELAHTRNVVHRDLKPANIMLGDFREVYVLDWGIARVLDEAEAGMASSPKISDELGATAVGAVIGTPMYMAPEQARGESVGPAADVFSLGAILFEILAREPLRSRAESETFEPSPARRRPDRAVAPELDATCIAALAEDETARPSARALGERVQRYLDGDRDLEARRVLAADHLARARDALAKDDRAGAMQEAGRALGLDPESDAAPLIGSILISPPAVLPAELDEHLRESDRSFARRQWRSVMWGYGAFFLFLPALIWQGVTDWTVFVALYAAAGTLCVHAAIGRRTGSMHAWPPLVLSGLLVMLSTRLLGTFMLLPAFLSVMCTSWFSYPTLMKHPYRLYAVILSFAVIPLALEMTGVITKTWTVVDGAIVSTSGMLHVGGTLTTVLLVGGTLGTLTVAAFFSRSLAFSRREAQRQIEIQAWHLSKLVGPKAQPTTRKRPSSPNTP